MKKRSAASSAAPSTTAPAAAFSISPRWLYAALFLVTLGAYFPALGAGIIWDDPGHITRPELQTLGGLFRIWFEPGATQQYYPLLHSAFWLEHQLWGDAPFGYHLVNLLLHATAACLFANVLRRLAVPGAWFAAFLFALHPVCVESVAWISEQKNTLSLVLYLCAALAYLRFESDRRPARYAVATALFVAAIATKTVTATLPAALLVLAWWQRGHLSFRRDIVPLLPWFACSAVGALVTAHFEHTLIGAQGADFGLTVLERGLLAGRVVWFYLGKLLWPADLIFVYPRWTIDPAVWWQWLFPLAALALLGALVAYARRNRAPLAVALLFGGSLFPALGFINVYPFLFSFVADHFQYLPSLAAFALAGAALTRLPRSAALGATAVLALVCAVLTFQQTRIYHDLFTLYGDTLSKNPSAWMAHNNLGVALVDADRPAEAVPHFEQACALHHPFAEGENNLADALNRLGRFSEAIPHLETALRLKPDYAEAHNNLGVAFMAADRAAEGLAQFTEAVRLKPDYPTAHRNVGLATIRAGRPADALPHFARAVELQPTYAQAHGARGLALTMLGRYAESIPHFETALRLNPAFVDAHIGLASALAATGRLEAAVPHYEQALALAPGHPEARRQLANALRQLGR